MTEANFAARTSAHAEWRAFWLNLKVGYDLFEHTRVPPKVGICNKQYAVTAGDLTGGSSPPTDLAAPCAESDGGGAMPLTTAATEAAAEEADLVAKPRKAASKPRHRAAARHARKAYESAAHARRPKSRPHPFRDRFRDGSRSTRAGACSKPWLARAAARPWSSEGERLRGAARFGPSDIGEGRVEAGFIAGGIGIGCRSGEGEGLAAAAAPIQLREIRTNGKARCTRAVPRKGLKRGLISTRSRADCGRGRFEEKPIDRLGCVAGEDPTRRRNGDDAAAPTAHAWLGPPGVVVRHDEIDNQHTLQSGPRLGDELGARQHLFTRRHQGLPVLERPAVVLHMRDLEAPGAEVERELDDGGQAGNILTVDRRVKRQGEIERLRPARYLQFFAMSTGIVSDAVGVGGVAVLDRNLHVIEAAGGQVLEPLPCQQNPGGDQVRVKAGTLAARAMICARSRRTVGSPPDKCSCSTPSSAACANTSHHASVDSSSWARSRLSGFEQ